jgi:hypothetical protein
MAQRSTRALRASMETAVHESKIKHSNLTRDEPTSSRSQTGVRIEVLRRATPLNLSDNANETVILAAWAYRGGGATRARRSDGPLCTHTAGRRIRLAPPLRYAQRYKSTYTGIGDCRWICRGCEAVTGFSLPLRACPLRDWRSCPPEND